MAVTLDALVAAYNARRDAVAEIEQAAKDKTTPLKQEMKQLEGAMQKLLNEQGSKSVRTHHGTCYLSQWRSVKVQDWEDTLAWIRENERWDVLTHTVNKTSVLEAMDESEDGGCPVPGVSVDSGWKVNVRRS